jgi:alkylhydroperoxidase/carboxymuconolactone decarboxylase family protein YurZ
LIRNDLLKYGRVVILYNQENEHTKYYSRSLDAKQQCIVTISACTSIGDLTQLKNELIKALDAGLTIDEIREMIV